MNPKFFRNGIVMLALVVVALAVVFTLVTQSTPANDKAYNDFLTDVQEGQVSKIVQEGSKLSVTAGNETYTVVVPGLLADAYDDVAAAAAAGNKQVPTFQAQQAPDQPSG